MTGIIYKANKRGVVLINVLVFASIAVTVTIALVNWGATILKTTRTLSDREQAFQIAEAGVEYYRWHLAHASTDYKDGTSSNGPYIHTYKDADGDTIGQYELTITAPPVGSTLTKIKSKGVLASDTSINRTIETTLAIPSLAKYAVVANDFIRFGDGTEVFGPIHANNGIRFDGLAHNIITSAVDKFIDTEYGSGYVFGVYTTAGTDDPAPPAAVPSRPDVFMAGRQFPVPAADFAGLTSDLSNLKALAQSGGRYFAASGSSGYHIVLKTNDTFDLYKVTSLQTGGNRCSNIQNQEDWGTWSINRETFIANYAFPTNGIIFAEDHVWINGQISGARLTVAVGKFPETVGQYKNIIINNDLLYSSYDGSDVLGLIAQGNLSVGLYSEDDLRVDGALIAQNGRAGRHYYNSDCTNYRRTTLTLYGMIATRKRYGFAYTDNTGYTNRNIIYDGNLLYGPPPSFPLASSQYQTISWREVKQ